jgi:hypothetical protein
MAQTLLCKKSDLINLIDKWLEVAGPAGCQLVPSALSDVRTTIWVAVIDINRVTQALAKLEVDGSLVHGVQFRWDEDLHCTVADVLWVVPAPLTGRKWQLEDLDHLSETALDALGGVADIVYCRYRTPFEFNDTRQQDYAYFVPVHHAAA